MSNRKWFPCLRASWGNRSLSTLKDRRSLRKLTLVTMIDGNFQWSLKSYHYSLFRGKTTRWAPPHTPTPATMPAINDIFIQRLPTSCFIRILTCISLSHLTSNRTHLRYIWEGQSFLIPTSHPLVSWLQYTLTSLFFSSILPSHPPMEERLPQFSNHRRDRGDSWNVLFS